MSGLSDPQNLGHTRRHGIGQHRKRVRVLILDHPSAVFVLLHGGGGCEPARRRGSWATRMIRDRCISAVPRSGPAAARTTSTSKTARRMLSIHHTRWPALITMIGGFCRYNYGLIFDDLREIQRQYGYLPADQLEALARRSQIPLPHIHGVADFFPHFHLSPPPRVNVQVCADMSCHLRGADGLRDELTRRFGPMSDRDIAITDVSCLGQCDGAPAVRINDHSFRHVSAPQAEAIAIGALGGSAASASCTRAAEDWTGR